MRRALRRGLIALASVGVVAAGGWWGFRAITGTSPIVKYGSAIWIPVDENSWLLSKPVRTALHRPVAAVTPGSFDWRAVAAGFQTAEVPVMAGDFEVDRILIARIDPAKFRFKVVNDPTASTDLDGWMKRTGAALVVNGSYYGRDGGPATPTVIDGVLRGPKTYNAKQGAFVAAGDHAAIRDLQNADWHAALRGADTAFVSYPLLVAEDGGNRAPKESGWLANRSFIAEDRHGNILIGTTKGAYFTLWRLGEFLKAAPLDIKSALDLDGGPVACQAIALNGLERETCGRWEIRVDGGGKAKLLPTASPLFKPPMPMAIAVYPAPSK